MLKGIFRSKTDRLLSQADVKVGGDRDWDIHVHNDGFYSRILLGGSVGLGESYMDGWWDCRRLDEFFYRVLRAKLAAKVVTWHDLASLLGAKLFNLQRLSRAFQIGRRHYDVGNDLFRLMLDNRMIYSCGYWENAFNLDEAQEGKLDLIAGKLELTPGMKVLDIGCGWGGTAKYLAERYQVQVVGVTVSREQAAAAAESCRGLPVEIRLEDYRKVEGVFDRIVSVGMFEHVGPKNYKTFMRVARGHLAPDGLCLLHCIGKNCSTWACDPWIGRYIFPNSMLPSARWIAAAAEKLFVIEDWHNFGSDYDKTLIAWHRNFHAGWNQIAHKYGERFRRMWEYYLLSCAGAFRARQTQVWQIVLSPEGVPGGYRAARWSRRDHGVKAGAVPCLA